MHPDLNSCVGPDSRQWGERSNINPSWYRNPTLLPQHEGSSCTWACIHGHQVWPSCEADGFVRYRGSTAIHCPECGDGPFDPRFAPSDEEIDETKIALLRLAESLETQ